MTREMKDSLIFIVASLQNFADMTEFELWEIVELVGVDTIRELLNKGHLRYELSFGEMAEEIRNIIEWDSALDAPWRRDRDLAEIGLLIADMIDDASPADEDVAEQLFSFLTWEGIEEWLSINGKPGGLL